MEIFKRLSRNGIKKSDIGGIQTKALMWRGQRVVGQVGDPAGLSTLKSPKQICLVYATQEESKKPEGKYGNKKLDLRLTQATVPQPKHH